MNRRAFVFALVILTSASTSLAQPKEPIGRFVVDVRGASAGLPIAEGWTPVVPPGTVVPSRALGLEVSGHVYFLKLRGAVFGVGATGLLARGTTVPPAVSGSTATPTLTRPDLTTRLSSATPELSLNFGHSLGWSYLSAGLGRTHVESEATSASASVLFTPRDSGWKKTITFGGGARWFLTDRIGVGFDLRWYKLSLVGTTETHPGAPRASLVTAGVGISLK